ncbi:MAG: LON peptidase substrate-binding domain-containing protein [Chloroflexi bacterium]|nr:LON peptidase substrate-binding domain-containing protein [Chloroflexota bacterium]
MEAAERSLPLFPLNVVLFPSMMLPLHVFEERYKEMVRSCLDADSRFGVVLIKEGQEVGEPALPHTIGTVAHIRRVTPLEEGKMNLVVMGERRLFIDRIVQWSPYVIAQVHLPQEQLGEPAPTPEEVQALRTKLERYLKALLGLQGGWTREVPSPTDPVALGFHIAAVLRGENDERQRVLEAPTARERLTLLAPFLSREHRRVLAELRKRLAIQGARLN